MNNGLEAIVLRVGNLTGRYIDGVFQKNINDNMFYNMLKCMLTIGVIPNNILDMELELTPVDLCADAICKIASYKESNKKVYHLCNNNTISLGSVMETIEALGYKMTHLEIDDFIEQINSIKSLSSDSTALLLVNDYNYEKFLDKNYNVSISCKITNNYLQKVGFEWPIVDEDYIIKIMKHIEYVGFIKQLALTEN